jgi:hypothetical protein
MLLQRGVQGLTCGVRCHVSNLLDGFGHPARQPSAVVPSCQRFVVCCCDHD